MSPIAGVIFLGMQQQICAGRCRIGFGTEISNIGNALLFINHKIFHDRKVLSGCLLHQMLWRVAICPAVIHVDMNIAADPLRVRVFWQADWLEIDRQVGAAPKRNQHSFLLDPVLKSLHHLHFCSPCREGQFRISSAVKVMRLEGALRTNEVVVGMHPGIIGSIGATIFTGNENPRWAWTSVCGQHSDTELARGLEVMPFLNDDLRLRSTQYFLGP